MREVEGISFLLPFGIQVVHNIPKEEQTQANEKKN
jgi:hypothetical protein